MNKFFKKSHRWSVKTQLGSFGDAVWCGRNTLHGKKIRYK